MRRRRRKSFKHKIGIEAHARRHQRLERHFEGKVPHEKEKRESTIRERVKHQEALSDAVISLYPGNQKRQSKSPKVIGPET